jgi:hypothetical protein
MALVTGRECSLKVGTPATPFDDVVNSFELTFDQTSLTYDTLAGPRAAGGSESGTLSITFAYDSGETASLFDELWDAAGDPIAYEAKAGGSVYSGTAIGVRPSVPAKAGEVSEVTVELPLDGIPSKAAATVTP